MGNITITEYDQWICLACPEIRTMTSQQFTVHLREVHQVDTANGNARRIVTCIQYGQGWQENTYTVIMDGYHFINKVCWRVVSDTEE